MKAGKASSLSSEGVWVGSASDTAISTKLPVTWAVNRPNRALKPRVST